MISEPVPRIDPAAIAFDIDGVVADTMEVFVRLAHERYGLTHILKDDISSYDLRKCLEIGKDVLTDLICMTLDDEHTLQVPPMPGAPEVLSELAGTAPLRFVTARIWPESITAWLYQTLPNVPRSRITVVASGAPDLKRGILMDMGVRYFVEDRPETCRLLKEAGIQPFLFTQPWNRNEPDDGFIRIDNWTMLREWVLPPRIGLR